MSRQTFSPEQAAALPGRVSVAVPVYNGAAHLQECLESIAAQTYPHWDVVIVNNCSKDATGEIADEFARRDSRFRVLHCAEFLDQPGNYNRAIASASPGAEFVKLVEADNRLWPECFARMVEAANRDPQIGVVGSYYLFGRELLGWGVADQKVVISGDEVRRDHLLTDIYYLGTPTTMLYRASALAEAAPCFRPGLFYDDTDLCFRLFRRWKYGFVHQVLSFVRNDNDGISNSYEEFDFIPAYRYALVREYGPEVLTPDELRKAMRAWKSAYFRRLGNALMAGRSRRYWEFHQKIFRASGSDLRRTDLIWPAAAAWMDMIFNPKATAERTIRRLRRSLGLSTEGEVRLRV
jgi:glycosyltransferase involved in cell wall biosynthesis